MLQSNYLKVTLVNKHLYVYHLTILNQDANTQEQIKEPQLRRSIISELYPDLFFDSKEYLYSPHQLPTGCKSISQNGFSFNVVIKLHRKYQSKVLRDPTKVSPGYLQGFMYALDSVVRNSDKPQLRLADNRYLSKTHRIKTGEGYELWWEYRQTMRVAQRGLFCNMTARAVPVISVLKLDELSQRVFSRLGKVSRRDWVQLEASVKDLKLDSGQCIKGLVLKKETPQIELTNGQILDLSECQLMPSQVLTPLVGCLREGFQKASAVAPSVRQKILQAGIESLGLADNRVLIKYGIQINPRLEQIPYEHLSAPQLTFDRGAVHVQPKDSWSMDDKRLNNATSLTNWAVLVFGTPTHMPRPLLQTFVNQLIKVSCELGMDIQQCSPQVHYASNWTDIPDTFSQAVAPATQLVLCVLPFNSVSLYGEIKRTALTLMGVQTQCVVGQKVRAHCPKLLTSLALKINMKLGGTTSQLAHPVLAQTPTLVISADVNHTTEAGKMSVAAILSSVDLAAGRFQGTVLQHPQRQEYIENLDHIIRQSLRLFFHHTGQKPQQILYYRDGVSDSQIDVVKRLELEAIQKGCQLVDPQYSPKVTAILVRKRHHSRFVADGAQNCPAGTCVSTEVVSPHYPSFYLLSHKSPFGVSRPAYYLVIQDDQQHRLETLQELTYHLSYTYPILSRSVTMPAPLYYAHRLTGKGRLLLDQPFSQLPHFTNNSSSSSSSSTLKADPHLVPVHKNLQDTMFFM